MNALKVIVELWKAGAKIEVDKSDGALILRNHEKVPADVMKNAEVVFNEIEQWVKTWESETPENKTIQRAWHHYIGWRQSDAIQKFLQEDEYALMILRDWVSLICKGGYKSLYGDFRHNECDEAKVLKQIFYERATKFSGK